MNSIWALKKKIKPFNWKKGFPEVFKEINEKKVHIFKPDLGLDELKNINDPVTFNDIKNQGGFDVVIGNPPYSYMISNEQQKYFSIKFKHQDYQKDLYLLFLERYKDILKQEGLLGVIISNTWLQSITLRKIRSFLSTNYEWKKILLLPEKVFSAVVDTHVIIFNNRKPSKKSVFEVEILKNNILYKSHIINQGEINKNGDQINVSANCKVKSIFKTILEQNPRLSESCIVYNGVKPFEKGKGKPPQTDKTLKEKPFVFTGKKPDKKWSPLLRGSLINRYTNLWNENYWILYGEWLAAPRDYNIFKHHEKIMVRQTGDTLIATLISNGFIARNNLHIIICKSHSTKYILGLINSRLMDLLYTYLNPEKGEALAEVKKQHIELLPIKKITNDFEKKCHDEIILHVDLLLKLNKELQVSKLPTEIDQIKQRIEHSEDKINQLVYELYGLTKEEIKIIEGGSYE